MQLLTFKFFYQNFLPVVLMCIFYTQSNSQKIFYSDKQINIAASNSLIIGQIKDHILIWDNRIENPKKSEVSVYDNDMHFINKVKINILPNSRFYKIDVINNIDSFQIIYQYISRKKYFCKRAIFDENANCKEIQLLDSTSIHVTPDYYGADFNNLMYGVIQSNNKQNFALVRAAQNQKNKIVIIDYHFFEYNHETSNKQILPFDVYSNNLHSLLINNNNLLLTVTQKTPVSYQLGIYNINLTDNTLSNSLRNVDDGYLINETLNISADASNYIVAAEWRNENSTNYGIFLWKLNSDLSDALTDTVVEKSFDSNSVTFNLKNFVLNAFQNNSNSLNLFVFSGNNLQSLFGGDFFSKNYSAQNNLNNNFSYYNRAIGGDAVTSGTNPYTGVVYSGKVFNDGLDDFISNSVALNNSKAYNFNNDTLIKYRKTVRVQSQDSESQDLKLSILQINNENKILHAQTFNSLIDKNAISYINESKVFNFKDAFYILFNQTMASEKQTISYIRIQNRNFTYTYNHLILMKLNYKILLDQSLQIDNSALIAPILSENKLAFVKIQFN